MAQVLADAIQTIGPDSVVQVVTDNAENCKAAVKIIEKKFPKITWGACTGHTLNLLLEDIGKMEGIWDINYTVSWGFYLEMVAFFSQFYTEIASQNSGNPSNTFLRQTLYFIFHEFQLLAIPDWNCISKFWNSFKYSFVTDFVMLSLKNCNVWQFHTGIASQNSGIPSSTLLWKILRWPLGRSCCL